MEHRVVFVAPSEDQVVCSCGEYFRTGMERGSWTGDVGTIYLGPGTPALEHWAKHLKESQEPAKPKVFRETDDVRDVHYVQRDAFLQPPICLDIDPNEPVALIGFTVTHVEELTTCESCLVVLGLRKR